MTARDGLSIGVDIGGTFTDVVVRKAGAPTRIMKIPSTRKDPSIAVLQALERMEADWGLPPQQIARFVHGTTVATNAVLERKGARVGLITTEGFRDVLEIGRQMRHQMYDLALDPETPTFLAPGRFRREVHERVSATGEVLQPLDEAAVAAAADELVAAGARAIAVVFLFSFLNDAHERRAREIISARHPDVFVSISCEVDPAFREYERTVVTTFDAYVKPVVDRYLANLDAGLTAARVPAPLQIMQPRRRRARDAAARLHDLQRRTDAGGAHAIFQTLQIATDDRLHIRIERGHNGAFIFAKRRIDLARQRHCNLGMCLFDQCAGALFMGGMQEGEQVAYRNRLHAIGSQLANRLSD